MSLFSFDPNLFMTLFLTHKCLSMAIFYFINLFLNFRTFNSKLNYIKYENNIFFQMGWIFILLDPRYPTKLANFVICLHMEGKSNFQENLICFKEKILHIHYSIFFHSLCHPNSLYKYQALCTAQDTKP